mmetsp:Transcript_16322/g.41697  ORF Transcript_16322/g.41697 Transcript_16322/m.41697 type:complete len:324 (+) Transcript_16322:181-1152(+)
MMAGWGIAKRDDTMASRDVQENQPELRAALAGLGEREPCFRPRSLLVDTEARGNPWGLLVGEPGDIGTLGGISDFLCGIPGDMTPFAGTSNFLGMAPGDAVPLACTSDFLGATPGSACCKAFGLLSGEAGDAGIRTPESGLLGGWPGDAEPRFAESALLGGIPGELAPRCAGSCFPLSGRTTFSAKRSTARASSGVRGSRETATQPCDDFISKAGTPLVTAGDCTDTKRTLDPADWMGLADDRKCTADWTTNSARGLSPASKLRASRLPSITSSRVTLAPVCGLSQPPSGRFASPSSVDGAYPCCNSLVATASESTSARPAAR